MSHDCGSAGAKFFQAFFPTPMIKYPKRGFFIRLRQASLRDDVQGVDWLVDMYSHRRGAIVVPLQIKGSGKAVQEYFRQHPDAKEAGVPVQVVREWHTPERVRETCFDLLQAVRDQELDFKDYLTKLRCKPLSLNQSRHLIDARQSAEHTLMATLAPAR